MTNNIIILFLVILSFILLILLSKKFIYENIYENINENINKNKTIWIYWDSLIIPQDVLLIIKNNKKILGEDMFTIKVLNKYNIKTYLDVKTFPSKYKSLSVQHKADLIRLKLLQKYGGIWLDASIIINSKSKLIEIYNKSINDKNELTAFTLTEIDNSYPYHQYIENWFIIAPYNSNIINLWLEEYEKAINMGFEEYNTYITNVLKIKICDGIKNAGTYLTQHKALQVVLQQRITYVPNILLLKSEESMFKLMYDCKWDTNCIKNKFKNYKEVKQLPYIKLRSTERRSGIDIKKYINS